MTSVQQRKRRQKALHAILPNVTALKCQVKEILVEFESLGVVKGFQDIANSKITDFQVILPSEKATAIKVVSSVRDFAHWRLAHPEIKTLWLSSQEKAYVHRNLRHFLELL